MYGEPMSSKDMVYYPSTCFDNKTLPEGKDMKVGKTYTVTLQLKMTGISQRQGRDKKERGHYDFDITGIEVGPEVKGKKQRYAGGDE